MPPSELKVNFLTSMYMLAPQKPKKYWCEWKCQGIKSMCCEFLKKNSLGTVWTTYIHMYAYDCICIHMYRWSCLKSVVRTVILDHTKQQCRNKWRLLLKPELLWSYIILCTLYYTKKNDKFLMFKSWSPILKLMKFWLQWDDNLVTQL